MLRILFELELDLFDKLTQTKNRDLFRVIWTHCRLYNQLINYSLYEFSRNILLGIYIVYFNKLSIMSRER